jgi:hypothetical protein
MAALQLPSTSCYVKDLLPLALCDAVHDECVDVVVVAATNHAWLLKGLVGPAQDLGSIATIHMQARLQVVGQGACKSAMGEGGTKLRKQVSECTWRSGHYEQGCIDAQERDKHLSLN